MIEAAIPRILAVLRERTGTDFTRYRTATVQRRIANRMISVGAASFDDYLALLQSSAGEAEQLLNRVSIKVSRFYRNRASFDLLRARVIPELAARFSTLGQPLRVWSAGCGCGEEPYTFAMLLDEAGLPGEVHATDIDPAALDAAEHGLYASDAATELPQELARSYLVSLKLRRPLVAVPRRLRARICLERLDLLAGTIPGGGGFDLVSCRNVLIYLQGEVRDQVLATLVGALRPGGYLFLGEAEWPPESLSAALESQGQGTRIFKLK